MSGPEIHRLVGAGDIEIDPYNPKHVNPASVDVTLGDTYVQYVQGDRNPLVYSPEVIWDAKHEVPCEEVCSIPEEGVVLRPGELYLMHTAERVHTKKFVPVLDGKSSIGRLGVLIHVTAGYGDPGFDGQYTLEVVVVHPVRLYAGMRIGQMRFHTLVGAPVDYRSAGHYTKEHAKGPVPSQAHLQFAKVGD